MKSKKEKTNQSREEASSSTEVENIEIISHPVITTHRLTSGAGSDTFFEPNLRDGREQTPQGSNDNSLPRTKIPAPEKRLTLFALRLAVLEKAASGLGSLGFVWATVVLLGGFAIKLIRKDFWFVTVILVSEAARTFSRSHELEWQHQSAWSLATAGRNSFKALKSGSKFMVRVVKALFSPIYAVQPVSERNRRIEEDAAKAQEFQKRIIGYLTQRAWHGPEVPLLPYSGWVFLSKNISRVLSWLQIVSAIACVSLSLIRLIEQNYGEDSVELETQNRGSALNLFYSLAVAEAIIFLLEKLYWTWKIVHGKLLAQVSQDCDLGADGMVIVKRFFYDAYSQSITGSIFDGIKMDLVTFAEELLDSTFLDEQLIAVRVLQRFVKSSTFSAETIRKIGTNARVIERLIEMLNWKSSEEEEIRKAAAEIVSQLAGKKHSALRVAGIPGAMESVSSLLYMGKENTSYDYSWMNLYGLLILKRLAAGNDDNCFKIGNTRGLLPRVIDFTGPTERVLQNELVSDSQIRAIRSSLKVVRMLVRSTGTTGKTLRQEISEIVFTVSNMKNILEYGGRYIELQRLAIDILTGLAMDEKAKERIASTGGVIRLLFSIFLSHGVEGRSSVRSEAGEAIAMLTLESKRNCWLILKKVDVVKLVAALDDPALQLNALRILRNLCAYSGEECRGQLQKVAEAMPFVLRATMEKKEKLLETSIGLTTQICMLIGQNNFITELERAKIQDKKYVETLTNILREYKFPGIEVPRIRRFVVQQAIWMMKHHKHYVELFKLFEMENLLESVGDSTSDLECFHVFSGSVGISQHRKHLSDLVDAALELLNST
ncbi:hypothetical protein LUZ60_008216 [Juncus effusus]|nr:hypothetical protein LUZ60_008216 [Juncus effusus]